MRIDNYLIGFIIFSVIIVTGVFIVRDVNTNYNVSVSTDDFNDTYNTIDDMYDIGSGMKSHTLDADISESESWESMTKGSYSAIRLVSGTFTLIGNIINDIAETLKIPAYFVKFALAALIIAVVFGIIYIFIRFKP